MDTTELRKLAEAADTSPHWYPPTAFTLVEKDEDATFIAAASPSAIRALLDERDEALDEIERLKRVYEAAADMVAGGFEGPLHDAVRAYQATR